LEATGCVMNAVAELSIETDGPSIGPAVRGSLARTPSVSMMPAPIVAAIAAVLTKHFEVASSAPRAWFALRIC
jgi:hypothetical protein